MKRLIPVRAVVFVLLAAIIFARLTAIYQPKRIDTAWNYTTKVNSFKNMEENTVDIIGFGSSHMYCSVVPDCIKQRTGQTAYVLATQRQPIKATYYYIREALKTQSPSVILLEAYMVNCEEEPTDAVIYDAIDPLPFSLNKLQMIADLTGDVDSCVPFFCTLLQYHTRWDSLSDIDYSYNPKDAYDPHNGYVYLTKAQPQQLEDIAPSDETAPLDETDKKYLDKIVQLTHEHDIQLVLLYAPYPVSQEEIPKINAIARYAAQNDIPFLNGWEQFDAFGLDLSTDFYDRSHLNLSGATKFTTYLCTYLQALDG